jgi:hypothetical protein
MQEDQKAQLIMVSGLAIYRLLKLLVIVKYSQWTKQELLVQ